MSQCRLLFPVALKQNLPLTQESLLIFYILTSTTVKKWKKIRIKGYVNEIRTNCITVEYVLRIKQKSLYFELEVDYYSKKISKNSCKKIQLIASTETTSSSWRADCTWCVLATTIFHTLLLGIKIKKSAKYIFQLLVTFVWEIYKSLYIYINAIYLNKNHHFSSWHNAGSQGYP